MQLIPGWNIYRCLIIKGNKMKRRYPVLTAMVIVSIFLSIPVSAIAVSDPFLEAGFIQARKQAPALDFTLEDLEGRQVRQTDFQGNIVLIFFWTTW